ncbi:hypothetical protein [Rhodopila sp.]|uniref:hypothetical protein n=1 Tax=Rhodopila sp. TaxID=2480087 RepID=UPI002D08A343|nr:hypothetical protein [Rhodopila sp.]HVZ10389.1 hypothetical protein [Rhodopila sp.]
MTKRLTMIAAAATFAAVGLTAQISQAQPAPHVPHDQVTPSRYKKHPRPVPEPTTIDSLNAMSLQAAQQGQNFVPPAPGNEHEKAAAMKSK